MAVSWVSATLALVTTGALILEWRRDRSIYWLAGAAVPVALLAISIYRDGLTTARNIEDPDIILVAFVVTVSAHALGVFDRPIRLLSSTLAGEDRRFNADVRGMTVPFSELIASYPEGDDPAAQERWRLRVLQEGDRVIASLQNLRPPNARWAQVVDGYAEVYSLYLDDLRSGRREHVAAVRELGERVVELHRNMRPNRVS